MYGENAVSEIRLACKCIERLSEGSAVMADSGFGVFFVAYHCRQIGHPFLLRLSNDRWRSLVKKAEMESKGQGWKSYRLRWSPSPKDRANNLDLPPDASLDVRLHGYVVHSELTFYMVTDIAGSASYFSECYLRRGDIEIDIRNIKVVMNAETLRAKSIDIFEKDLIKSMVAYKLVVQYRREAAELAGVEPRRMSFKRIWKTFTIFLLRKPATNDMKEW